MTTETTVPALTSLFSPRANPNDDHAARFALKLATAQSNVRNVPKAERNRDQGYNYASAEAIFAMVRPVMAEAGLAILPTTASVELTEVPRANDKTTQTVRVELSIRLIDTETGYTEAVTFQGYGRDYGDKAMPKAYTMAAKTFARVVLMVDLQDDAEQDSGEYDQAPQRPPSRSRQPAQRSERPQPPTPPAPAPKVDPAAQVDPLASLPRREQLKLRRAALKTRAEAVGVAPVHPTKSMTDEQVEDLLNDWESEILAAESARDEASS